ncbi:MAG: EscU/YscU/HrcU family type III secretion system export apparatus switch protein [Spirochaetes bacterium]|nr:EscU/YscU/HrcU family type III secretion system export apparatus switch protein [Spirochaetota bacterium]
MGKKAIALQYSPDKGVPEILAAARGILVDNLLKIARENNITIYNNSDLVEVLSSIKPGDQIPENLFGIISEVLAYCYNVNIKFKKKLQENYQGLS